MERAPDPAGAAGSTTSGAAWTPPNASRQCSAGVPLPRGSIWGAPRVVPDSTLSMSAEPAHPSPSLSHTKVIATIGPASEGGVGDLIDAGMSVARINLSHGTEEDFLRRVAL